MRKRRIKVLASLAAICLVLALSARVNGVCASPLAVHEAAMRGMHMGPAEALELSLENEAGEVLYLSRLDDTTLFITAVSPTWGAFWKPASGGWTGALSISGYEDGIGAVANHKQGFPLVFGITNCPGAAWVSLTVSHENVEQTGEETFRIPVEDDGFFSQEVSVTTKEEYLAPVHYEVYDKSGQLIWPAP